MQQSRIGGFPILSSLCCSTSSSLRCPRFLSWICLLRWLQCEGPQVDFVWRQVDQFVWVIVLFGIPFSCDTSPLLISYHRSSPEDCWKEERRQMQRHWRCCLVVVVVVVGAAVAVEPSICFCAWGRGSTRKAKDEVDDDGDGDVCWAHKTMFVMANAWERQQRRGEFAQRMRQNRQRKNWKSREREKER